MFAELTDSPFDYQKGIILGVPSPTSDKGKYNAAKRKIERNRPHHKDKEIDELLRVYGEENVTILYDSLL